MDDTLVSALLITAIGMTLLFLTLVFFYGLLSLLTATIRDRPAGSDADLEPVRGAGLAEGAKLEAAAVAIALARSQATQRAVVPVAPGQEPAARGPDRWWSLHHQRRLTHSPDMRRRR